MANQKTIKRIEFAAKFLETRTAQDARGYLDPPLERALEVLDCMSDGQPHDYEEIANEIGLNRNTVQQIINALDRGGYPLTFTYAMVKEKTGRKPVAVQKNPS